MAFKAKRYTESYDNVFQSVIEALEECEYKITYKNKHNGTIKASTGGSLLSWGGEIRIKIKKEGQKIRVEGNTSPEAQVFDWGQSRSDLLGFFETLNKILQV